MAFCLTILIQFLASFIYNMHKNAESSLHVCLSYYCISTIVQSVPNRSFAARDHVISFIKKYEIQPYEYQV